MFYFNDVSSFPRNELANFCIKSTESFFFNFFEKELKKTTGLNNFDDYKKILFNNNTLRVLSILDRKTTLDTSLEDFLKGCVDACLLHIESSNDIFLSYLAASFSNLKIISDFSNFSLKHNIKNFKDYVRHMQSIKLYSNVFYNYLDSELEEAEKFISFERDSNFDYCGISTFKSGYMVSIDSETIENIQYIFLSCALSIAVNEKENRMSFVKEIYDVLSLKKVSLATPTLINLRKNKGNYSSCFILKLDDSCESILYGLFTTGVISKNLGGVGVNCSRLRALGSMVGSEKGASGGVTVYLKLFNDCVIAFSQNGLRTSAVTVSLDIWHKDIVDFLHIQSEVGDQRTRCYDIFPQVVIEDEFMFRLKQKSKWYTFCPYEVKKEYGLELDEISGESFSKAYNFLVSEIENKTIKVSFFEIDSMELYRLIIERQIESGLPYIFFKSTANISNPNKHVGTVSSGNLCMESFSLITPLATFLDESGVSSSSNSYIHTCNLASLNLSNLFSEKEISDTAYLATKILNSVLELTDSPTKEIKSHNNDFKTIGLGYMGLADHLAFKKLSYKDSSEYVSKISEIIALSACKSSVDLAKKEGSYKFFKGSEWEKGIYFGKNFNEKVKCEFYDEWIQLKLNIDKYGIRNSQIIAIAPNTNSSLINNCSASILPVYSTFFLESNAKGIVPNITKYFHLFGDVYTIYSDVNPEIITDVISSIQSWVDQGVSYELFYDMSRGFKASQIFKHFIYIWEKKCKTIYYVRTKTINTRSKLSCESCSL